MMRVEYKRLHVRITDKNGIKMRVPINFDDFDELNIERGTECVSLC